MTTNIVRVTKCIVCLAFAKGVGPEVVLHRREAHPLCTTHRTARGRYLAWTKPQIGTPEGDRIVRQGLLEGARKEMKNLNDAELARVAEATGVSVERLTAWGCGDDVRVPGDRLLGALHDLSVEQSQP